jgi:hypothetical protein
MHQNALRAGMSKSSPKAVSSTSKAFSSMIDFFNSCGLGSGKPAPTTTGHLPIAVTCEMNDARSGD